MEASAQFSQVLNKATVSLRDGLIRREGPIVEAFPNAFLGVLLPEEVFC